MLALIVFPNGDLATLDFGSPPEPELTPEEHVRAILADFAARKAELLDIGFSPAVGILTGILESSGDAPSALLPPIRALGFLGRSGGVEAVSRHVRHPDLQVRLAVIRSLGQMGKYDSMPLLELLLKSLDRQERREAIIAVGKFPKPEKVAQINSAAGSDPELGQLAREAEARIATTAKGMRTGRYDEMVTAVIETDEFEDLAALMLVTRIPLLNTLSDSGRSPRTRERAMRLVVMAGVRKAGAPMRAILSDRNNPLDLRLRAAHGLGMTRTRGAVPQLIELLDDPQPAMRGFSILSLGRIGDTRALEPLLARWEAADSGLRDRLRLAIYRLRTTSGVTALLEPLRTYQPRAIADVYFISDSLELSRGYRGAVIAPYLNSDVTAQRRDALLLLATFGTAADSPLLQNFSEIDPDELNREIANLGVERLKDIPIWERP